MSNDLNNLVFIGDLTKYTDKLDTDYKARFERLKKECDRYFDMEISETHPNASITFMGIFIANLALCYRLTLDEKYLNETKRWMNGVLGYEKWGNAHMVNLDLSASWILWGLSLGFDWVHPYLTDAERDAVYNKMSHHVKIMYDYMGTVKSGWPVNYCQNHNWINVNSIATTGYVMQKYKNEGSEYIQKGIDNFKIVYDLMADDGSNYEGVSYWRYGGMWLFIYAHLAKTQSNIDFFKTSQYLKNTFTYRLYQSAGDLALQVNFGDSHDKHSCHASSVYYKAASEYNDEYAQYFAKLATTEWIEDEAKYSQIKPGILPEAVLEFIFYNPEIKEKELKGLPKFKYFEDLGLISMRTGFEADSRVFSFKCGYPGGKKQWLAFTRGTHEGMTLGIGHHHPDNLSYILCNGKEYFIREDGYNNDTLPAHHSVLLVDGKYSDVNEDKDIYRASLFKRQADNPNFDAENEFHGSIEYIKHVDELTIFKADNTKIYPLDLKMKEVSRTGIVNEDIDFIVFVDKFVSEDEHIYSAICNTDNAFTQKDENSKSLVYGDKKATYMVVSADGVVSESYPQRVTAVMTTQEPDKKCIVDMITEQTSSPSKTKQQIMVEVIGLDESATISYENSVITIKTSKKEYKLAVSKDSVTLEANGEKLVF